MQAGRYLPRVAAIVVLLLFPLTAYATTVDLVTVTGRAETREEAILQAERVAVRTVAERYVAAGDSEEEQLSRIDQVLPYSKSYMLGFEILEERVDEGGFTEIVALARVEVGRLVTTLRNLDIDVTLFEGPEGNCC
jgi:hypothetical protein